MDCVIPIKTQLLFFFFLQEMTICMDMQGTQTSQNSLESEHDLVIMTGVVVQLKLTDGVKLRVQK